MAWPTGRLPPGSTLACSCKLQKLQAVAPAHLPAGSAGSLFQRGTPRGHRICVAMAACAAHPFTAPAASPWTTNFCASMYSTITGTAAITDPAIIGPHR